MSASQDSKDLVTRIRFKLRRFVLMALSLIRRKFAVVAQTLQRDELGELRHETRALGSASAEAVSHVGAELQEINERLARLERDVARLTEAGGDGASSAEASQPLSAD